MIPHRKPEDLSELLSGLTAEPLHDWLLRAACHEGNQDFFPSRGQKTEAVEQTCWSCPVRSQCLIESLRFPLDEQFGWFGGRPPQERKKLIRELSAKAAMEGKEIVFARPTLSIMVRALIATGLTKAEIAGHLGHDPDSVGRILRRAS